jgi:hypothetical protein
MDDKQRLQLQNLINVNNTTDQTELIRNLKHSNIIRDEVNNMILIKSKYKGDEIKIHEECINECNFLFSYYTDIYNKVRKDEIELSLLYKFLDILKNIEDGKLDQHKGSFLVGTILKEIYIDSALKKAEKLNNNNENNIIKQPKYPENKISWKQFKKTLDK